VGLNENKQQQLQKQQQVQKQMRGFFASLRMTRSRGGFEREQATATAKTTASAKANQRFFLVRFVDSVEGF
jgi:hypothetical protein